MTPEERIKEEIIHINDMRIDTDDDELYHQLGFILEGLGFALKVIRDPYYKDHDTVPSPFIYREELGVRLIKLQLNPN